LKKAFGTLWLLFQCPMGGLLGFPAVCCIHPVADSPTDQSPGQGSAKNARSADVSAAAI
jgi:hypothetical protein